MKDIVDPRHEALIEHLFRRACVVLEFPGFVIEPLRRKKRGTGKFNSYRLGYTRLNEKKMTVDLYTPRTMKPRKIDAILRVVAHELAHHTSPPKRIRVFLNFSWQHHHPAFWQTYKKFVARLVKDEILHTYFEN